MKILRIFTALLVTVLVPLLMDAQTRKVGINGAAFLKVGVGARHIGVGSAATAITEDATNMFWNPAGMALTNNTLQASFNYNKWIADIGQNAVAVSYRVENVGTFGIGVVTFGVSDIIADRDIYPNNPDLQPLQIDQASGSTYNYMDLMVQVSYASYVSDRLSLGVSVKVINEAIDDKNASAIAFDFGSVYHIGLMDWTIGARLNNLGSDLKFYDFAAPLPLTFGIGTSIVPYTNDFANVRLNVDAVKPQDGMQYFYTGAEVTLMKHVAVRGGYKFNYSGIDDGGSSIAPAIKTTIEGASFGASFGYDTGGYGLRVDYAYTQMDLLDATHRITLSIGMK